MKLIQKIFSVTNEGKHKVVCLLGCKIKIKVNAKYINHYINKFKYIKSIEDNKWCTGCSACKNICKQDAIIMQENEEGFLIPHINKNKCTNCGLCRKVCPIINFKILEKSFPTCYAVQASDTIRFISSSGGFFSIAARYILNQGGYVCGVKYDEDFYSVKHVIISNIEELNDLLVSKYVQSDLKNVFTEIKTLLCNNKKVLFVGTPCQVAGLKSFLNKSYKNLYILDLVCCGVPSRKVYRKFLDEIKTDSSDEIKSVKFRLKDNGWYTRCIEVNTKNTVYRIKNNDSAYQQLHFRGLSTNKVCGICPYDRFPREGDITIGDFWNIDKFNKKLDDNKGTSLIFLNTIQGKELMNSIKTQFKLNKHVPINWSFNGNKNLILPIRHRNRRQFFYNLDKLTLEDNYSQCLRDTCDCAVLNNAITSVNYGSMLTAYAIQETLLKLGFFAKIINTSRIPIKNYENTFGYAFTDEYLNLTEKCDNNDDFIMLNNKTKNFLVGSDQMWRIKYLGHMIDKCLLDFVESSKNKISISVSFGLDKLEGNYLDKEHFKRSLQTFKALSTREKSGVNICRELGYNAEWLLDPVFLLDKEKYFDMIKYSNCDCSDKLVYYMWEQSDETKQCIDYLSKKLKCKSYDITSKKLNVENWLSAINSCKYFVSNSYHGICFAIIFHKPFLCINNMGVARFDSLKDLFHIEKQIITNCNLLYKSDAYLEKVNFDYIDKIIHKEKLKALEFLERNIVN